MVGQRTRASLEREKMLALRAIKELEFDRAMGKLSEADWNEMSGRLRARAARLIRQLDAGANYREQIERDLASGSNSSGATEGFNSRSSGLRVHGDVGIATADPTVAPIARRARRQTTRTPGFARAAGRNCEHTGCISPRRA